MELKKSKIKFDAENHRYFYGKKELQGITSTLVERAFPDSFAGVSEEKLAERAEYGTSVHNTIEFSLENDLDGNTPEWQMFKKIIDEQGLKFVKTEYIVSDYKRYASPIDVVFEREDGTAVLVDIKTNYRPLVDKATLQLSWYKRQFEAMNPHIAVSECAVIWVRNDEKRGQLSKYIPIVPWSTEALDLLIESDTNDLPFDINATYGDLPVKFGEVEDTIASIEQEVKALKERQQNLKDGLYALMEEHNVKSWTGSKVKLTRVLPTTKITFDSAKFKEENPDLYSKYTKESQSAGSLRITIID